MVRIPTPPPVDDSSLPQAKAVEPAKPRRAKPKRVKSDHRDSGPPTSRIPEPGEARKVASPGAPLVNARKVIAQLFQERRDLLLRSYRGDLYEWSGAHWTRREDAWLRQLLFRFFERATFKADDGRQPFNPTKAKVANLEAAVNALTHLAEQSEVPLWLGAHSGPDPRELVPVHNGLLHLASRTLLEHTPRFFSLNAAPVDYDAAAPRPERFLRFVDELFGDDQQAKDTLQEMFGYLLSSDTSQQKIFMLVGPKRSGKSTIGRVVRELVGHAHVAAPTLASLTMNFGLQTMIGKSLAIIADARLSGQRNHQVVVERLLSISGEDALDIDRKYKAPWTGRLLARLLILTNELPALVDPSGALASRFIIISFTETFYGREDTELTEKLFAELPGILNWALDGLDRLHDRGRFIQPDSGRARVDELEALTSPVGAFLRERCIIEVGMTCRVSDLFDEWDHWCVDRGRNPGTVQSFGHELNALGLPITRRQPRTTDGRERWYEGIGLVAHDGTRSQLEEKN